MKELSNEDKAKRYDEALQRTRRWYDANTNEGYRGIFEDIFPELKESKDEKIRKVIYGWIYTQPSQFFDSGFSKAESSNREITFRNENGFRKSGVHHPEGM